MIKARICGGDNQVGNQFIANVLSPFIWRKNLDYAAIEDILAMKRQIHAVKGGDHVRVSGQDVKIGWGGIREIEFFAQVQQLILGGRNPELRERQTLAAINKLCESGFVTETTGQTLSRHYATLRRYEHVAQMMLDEQTHKIPSEPEAKARFMTLLGYPDETTFDRDSLEMFSQVHEIFGRALPGGRRSFFERRQFGIYGCGTGSPKHWKHWTGLGFDGPGNIWREMADWLGGRIAATRSERARELLTKLAPIIIETCADTPAPDKAFHYFGQFFTRIRAGVKPAVHVCPRAGSIEVFDQAIGCLPICRRNPCAKTGNTRCSRGSEFSENFAPNLCHDICRSVAGN